MYKHILSYADKINAKVENGILEVTVMKNKEIKPKSVPIAIL